MEITKLVAEDYFFFKNLILRGTNNCVVEQIERKKILSTKISEQSFYPLFSQPPLQEMEVDEEVLGHGLLKCGFIKQVLLNMSIKDTKK